MMLIRPKTFFRIIILVSAVLASCASLKAQGIFRGCWGTTRDGGPDGVGTIFSTDTTGAGLTSKYIFNVANKGGLPIGAMVTYNSKLYGVAQTGGVNNKAIIFQFDPATNVYSKLTNVIDPKDFSEASDLALYNGFLYGTTKDGGVNQDGSIYKYDPATNITTTLYSFAGTDGHKPLGTLVLYNSKFYGTTYWGGTNDRGVVYQFDPATATYTKLFDMGGGISNGLTGSLAVYNNKLYGTSTQGFTGLDGSVFEFDIATNTVTQELQLVAANGEKSDTRSLLLYNNKLFGLSEQGGAGGVGVLFEYDPATNKYTKRFEFDNASSFNGTVPEGGLIANGGKLLGLTHYGGANSVGTLFEFDEAANTYTKKADLDMLNGSDSYTTLLSYGGNFYGTTRDGGSAGVGAIFKYDAVLGIYTKKADFGTSPASNPSSSLTYFNKTLYGTTQNGGSGQKGTLFKCDPVTGTTTILMAFDVDGGAFPMGDLVVFNNKLYGMAMSGGINNSGAIFCYEPSTGTYTKVYDLNPTLGGNLDISIARYNSDPLLLYNNKFYGITHNGGLNNAGVIFQFDPVAINYTVLYNFVSHPHAEPTGNLVQLNGKFYGLTTADDGILPDYGKLFEFDPGANTFTNKYSFTSADALRVDVSKLSSPGLTVYNDKVYGVTFSGSTSSLGFLFQYDPAAGYTKKVSFSTAAGGTAPTARLMLRNSILYGMTYSGGTGSAGVIYQYNPLTNISTVKSSFVKTTTGAGAVGTNLISLPALVADGNLSACKTLTAFTNATNTGWKPIADITTTAVAEVSPNGNNLGTITPSYYVQGNPVRNFNGLNFLNRSITINVTNQPSTPVDVRLYVKKSEVDDLIATPGSGIGSVNDLTVYESEAACSGTIANDLVKLPSVVSDWFGDYVFTVQVSSFSTFHFAAPSIVTPVTLLNFSAIRKNKNEVLLNWATSEEINSDFFSIERSDDAQKFTAVGSVAAAGTSSIKKDYQFTDIYSSVSDVYYRLKMIDKDGKYKYSKTVKVRGLATAVSISPNPAHNTITITGAHFTQMQIFDATGKLVKQFAPSGNNQYNIAQLSQGMYILCFVTGADVVFSQFVKL